MTTRVEAQQRLDEWCRAAFESGDADLLARCGALVARTLGADPSSWPDLPAAWWEAAELDGRDRAVLAFTEQWLADVSQVGVAHVEALLEHLTPDDVLGLLMGLVAVEQRIRVTLCLDRLVSEPAP
jgi:alkylhydroperoxidase family enzyme